MVVLAPRGSPKLPSGRTSQPLCREYSCWEWLHGFTGRQREFLWNCWIRNAQESWISCPCAVVDALCHHLVFPAPGPCRDTRAPRRGCHSSVTSQGSTSCGHTQHREQPLPSFSEQPGVFSMENSGIKPKGMGMGNGSAGGQEQRSWNWEGDPSIITVSSFSFQFSVVFQ